MDKPLTFDVSSAKPPDCYEALILLDQNGNIVQMNLNAEELSGYLASELQGSSLWQIIREDESEANSQNEHSGPQYFLRKKESSEIPISLRFSPLIESGGIQLAFIRNLMDSDEQEVALKAQQIKLNALLEAIPDSIFIQDAEGNFLDYYPPVEGSIFPPDTLVQGRNITELLPKRVCRLFLKAFTEVHKDRFPQKVEFTMGTDPVAYYEARLVPMNNHKILSIVREVTHSRSMQNILHLRNQALEAAGNGIIISDMRQDDQPVIYVNLAFTEITGYEPSEVIGKNCRFLQGKDRDQKGIENIRKALKAQEPCREIVRNYRKDGTLFWNELTLTPLRDVENNASHFIGVIHDVSQRILENERKDRIREILQDISEDQPLKQISNRLCELLVNQMGGGASLISILDESDNTLEALAWHGLPKAIREKYSHLNLEGTSKCPCEEAAKLRQEKIIPDLDANPEWQERASQLKAHRFHACWSFPIRSLEKEILGTCTLFSFGCGQPTGEMKEVIQEVIHLTGVAIDRYQIRQRLEESKAQLEAYTLTLEQSVEERTREVKATFQKLLETNINLVDQIETTKEAESRAMANQALFAAIARNFPRGFIMVVDGALQIMNLEGEDLEVIGLESWDYKGQDLEKLPVFTESQKSILQSKVAKTLKGSDLTFDLSHAAHSYIVNSTPLSLQDSEKWALLVFSNSTAQKRTEKELMRALRIEQELNDLKSRFISMASHEFRTPLSAILSSATLIGKQNEPEKAEKRTRYVQQIKNNVRNLVVILDDFLSLSKLEEGELVCQPSEFDLIALLRKVLEELENTLKIGQHFVEDCQRADFTIYQDPKFTRQIMVNLISNAIKYSPENSAIRIGISKRADRIILSVQDEGMGIPEDEQSKLFNRFFRARNAFNIPGTGLGLHIVKQYTERMGGNIHFDSNLDSGSTFYVDLPRRFKSEDHETSPHH